MIDPLTRLAILHGTDKFGMHDYTPVYHAHFEGLRDRPLRLLEIGVGGYSDPERGGRSLAMWRDYFPNAQIVGFDISEKRLDLGPRVTIRQGSQVDAGFLAELVADHGPFDIIVDDGSHHNDHVWRSFEMLFPALVPGGIYVVEDVQTAFFSRFGGSLTLTAPNILRSFGDLMLDLPHGRMQRPDWPAISRIDRQHNMIIVTTCPAGAPAATLANPSCADRALAFGRAALWGSQTLAGPRVLPADPALWGDETALTKALDGLADGQALALAGWPGQTAPVAELFAQIDHVERGFAFPHVAPIAAAPRVIQLSAFADGIMLVKGPNDFPSNGRFHFASPRARTAFERIYAVLSDPGADPVPVPDALTTLIGVVRQIRGMAAAVPLLRRLAAIGASDVLSLSTAIDAALECGLWAEAATIADNAHEAVPDCPLRRALLAWCLMRRDGGTEAASDLLGMPRKTGRPVVLLSLLAQVEQARHGASGPELAPESRDASELAVPVAALRLDLMQRLTEAARAELASLAPSHVLVADKPDPVTAKGAANGQEVPAA